MEKVLLTIIAALGLCAVSSHTKRQYHFIYDQKNLTEALSYCREKYTDLATIDTMEDMKTLTAMANLSQMYYAENPEYRYRAWIGLYDDVKSWRWSLSDTGFYKDKEAEFRNWKSGEPNNQGSKENCAVMYQTGSWNDDNCEELFMPICSDVRGSSVRFVLINISMTWAKAQNYCRTHYTDLASVRNMTENQEVKKLVSSGQKFWIGLFRDTWKWLDGSNSSFRYWKMGEPNNKCLKEACVAADFNHSGQWEDFNCDYKRAFICYTAVSKRVVKIKMVMQSSTLNPNDPAAMEDIIKQLKQKFKDKGVNEDVKLSWNKQADGKVFHKDEETTKKRNTILKKEEF